MQWSVWRWLRLIALILVVAWLGQRFLLENSNIKIPWLSRLSRVEKFEESNSDVVATLPSRSPSRSPSGNFPEDGSLSALGQAELKTIGQSANPTSQTNPTTRPTFTPVISPAKSDSKQNDQATTVQNSTQVMTETSYVTIAPATFPYISDTDVILALNQYRASHQIHQLVEQENLCRYAEKRLGDLLDFGGLDHHQGFEEDFAGEEIPEELRSYPGTTIGENLAYQHCINMQTGEAFIANSATALIEWCFDSSTAGHREAQLNPKFNNVCVRHRDGLFVVMFGD